MAESRPLPESFSALLCHVQEQALCSCSDQVKKRLIRLLQCISPRITPACGSSVGRGSGAPEEEDARGIDQNVVRSLCAEGVPDEAPVLRAALWKVVLGYLPADVFHWDSALSEARVSHAHLVHELLEELAACHTPEELGESAEEKTVHSCALDAGRGEERHVASHPQILHILDQINKDVFRTRPELDFFARPISGNADEGSACGRGHDGEVPDVVRLRFHYDAIARILLLYAWLNPGVRYVQGMNELCAPLYYLYAQDPLNCENAEADTFFCFSLVMADMRDAFVKALDHTEDGMLGRIDRFSALLRAKDLEVWRHLETLKVSPLYYAIRWMTLMLTQELEMPDVLRVWDALLCERARPHPFLHYVCVGMVIRIREELLAGDFTDCLGLLQRYPSMQVDELLRLAARLRAADRFPGGLSSGDPAASAAAPRDRDGRGGALGAGVWVRDVGSAVLQWLDALDDSPGWRANVSLSS